LWQLADFHCGSWPIFIVAVGGLLKKLAEIFGGFKKMSYLCTRKQETMVP
jgi:hypothetical protein